MQAKRTILVIVIAFLMACNLTKGQHYTDWTGFGFVQYRHPIWGTFVFNELTQDYTVNLTEYFLDQEKLPDGYEDETGFYYNWAFSLSPCEWDFLLLERGGILTIKKGYRWDGATNGVTDRVFNHRSSLLHDALYDLMRMYYLEPDEFELGDPSDADNAGDHNREMADMIYYMISIEDGDTREEAESDYFWIRSAGWIGTTFNEYQLKPWKFHSSKLSSYIKSNHILLEWQKSNYSLMDPDPIAIDGYYVFKNGKYYDTIDGAQQIYYDYNISENEFCSYQIKAISSNNNNYDWSNQEYIRFTKDENYCYLQLDGEDDCFMSGTVCNDLYYDTSLSESAYLPELSVTVNFIPNEQSGIKTLFSFNTLDGSDLIELVYDGDNNQIIYLDTAGNSQTITVDISHNQWNKFEIVYDSVGYTIVYFNGLNSASFDSQVRPSRGGTLTLGYNCNSSANHGFFKGKIGEFIIWKKALTFEQIVYNENNLLTGQEKDLIAYWLFNEPANHFSVTYWGNEIKDNVVFAYDVSSYGNDGIIEGHLNNLIINELIDESPFLKLNNYPNPFIRNTVIEYYLPLSGDINLAIYSQDGKVIHELLSGEGLAGRHILTWNANNLPAGIYYCMLQTFQTTSVIKMVLEK